MLSVLLLTLLIEYGLRSVRIYTRMLSSYDVKQKNPDRQVQLDSSCQKFLQVIALYLKIFDWK